MPHSQNQSKVVSHMLMQVLSNKKWGSVDVKHIPPGGIKLKQHDSCNSFAGTKKTFISITNILEFMKDTYFE